LIIVYGFHTFKNKNISAMKNRLLLVVLFVRFATHGFGQEFTVNIVAMPDILVYD